MKLLKLQDNDKEAKKLRLEELLEGYKDIEEVKKVMKGKKCIRLRPELENFFRNKNSQVFHYLQFLLMNTSLTSLNIFSFESNTLSSYIKYLFSFLVISVLE